jgi:hypothetical protein
MTRAGIITGALLTGLLGVRSACADIVFGYTDDFEGTPPLFEPTFGWGQPGTSPGDTATLIPNAGPSGTGDTALKVISTGPPAPGGITDGTRMNVFNAYRGPDSMNRWSGDYAALGIQNVQADIKNVGPGPMELRIAISDFGGDFSNWFSSSYSIIIPNDSVWRSYVFSIRPEDMVVVQQVSPSLTYAGLLAGVNEIRIIQAAAPSFQGDEVVGELHLDNITATVPEPGAAGLLLVGAAGLFRLLRLRRPARPAAGSRPHDTWSDPL